ncbi:MAG: DsbA family protein, partial [Nitrosopumilus sp.]
MSFEDNEIEQNQISQNKSKSNGLIIGLILAVGVAAFFAGMYFSNINSNQISQDDLDDAIAKLELK